MAAQAARATRGLYRPQLGGAAEVRYNAIQPTSILPNFANPGSGERVAVHFGTKFQATTGLTFNQHLYDANALAQRRVDATNQPLAANATLRGRVALVQTVSTAYYEALLRETQLAFAQADHARAQAAYQDQAARQQAGHVLALETLDAEVTRQQAQRDYLQAVTFWWRASITSAQPERWGNKEAALDGHKTLAASIAAGVQRRLLVGVESGRSGLQRGGKLMKVIPQAEYYQGVGRGLGGILCGIARNIFRPRSRLPCRCSTFLKPRS